MVCWEIYEIHGCSWLRESVDYTDLDVMGMTGIPSGWEKKHSERREEDAAISREKDR